MSDGLGPTRRLASVILQIKDLENIQAQVELYLKPELHLPEIREVTEKVRAFATEQAREFAQTFKQELIGELAELQRESNKEIDELLGQSEKQQPSLPQRVLAMCKHRNWSLHWTARGAYLHLEASELIESLRGKRGDPKLEAADVVIVLMSIIEEQGIAWDDVLQAASDTVDRLMTAPPYKGEERMGAEPRMGVFTFVDPQDSPPRKVHDVLKMQVMLDEVKGILNVVAGVASLLWCQQYQAFTNRKWTQHELPDALSEAWRLITVIDVTMSTRFWDNVEPWRKKFHAEFGDEKLSQAEVKVEVQADYKQMASRVVGSVLKKIDDEFPTLADKIDRGNF